MKAWTDTALWQALERAKAGSDDTKARAAKHLAVRLELLMPDVVAVLASGEAPADFTLHDEGHGFRVAERMLDVVTPELVGQLAATELALLLLSAMSCSSAGACTTKTASAAVRWDRSA
ncbi:MAG TPA: hypothetical protein VGF69_08140 [Thermoanaerobaculia bacterium]|jgi:hypothetical protein